ncbi:hypothetical protein Mp_1g09230 [Marchantia polymorpha subsp. ruderalis]|uniref:Uncharacterized protein n=2 Tax=Marchantia polymorpha TaxID=3197 RepID=A0AAF6AN73_MARPO|nr:hypothetical protein MARPO_0660s0002 [Marchantia polymorpha]BBM97893.1 hypothetical protein Mp_1g09230 [Marchantia polymorpha subsp. ruderalis]|eukprot:PTQ26655.1 hypothetical protein MARPO_0660s0002 [Marchantia polymorpha]
MSHFFILGQRMQTSSETRQHPFVTTFICTNQAPDEYIAEKAGARRRMTVSTLSIPLASEVCCSKYYMRIAIVGNASRLHVFSCSAVSKVANEGQRSSLEGSF